MKPGTSRDIEGVEIDHDDEINEDADENEGIYIDLFYIPF